MSTDPSLSWIAQQLAAHRVQQKDLAHVLGLDPSAVTRLLKGHRRLKPREFDLLVEFFAGFAKPASATPAELQRRLGDIRIRIPDLATQSGIAAARLMQLKYRQGTELSYAEQSALAAALGDDMRTLFADGPNLPVEAVATAARQRRASNQSSGQTELAVYRPLSLLGGGWYGSTLRLAGHRAPPAALREASGGYGLFVPDPTASPYLLEGELCWLAPGRPALPGMRVLARRQQGRFALGYLERLVGQLMLRIGAAEPFACAADDELEPIVAIEAF